MWNRTDPFLRSKCWPLAGYPDQLITLVDAHYDHGAGNVSVALCLIQQTNMFIAHISNQITFELLDIQDQILLMLHWSSFCHGCIRNMWLVHLAQYVSNVVVVAILSFACLFSFITTLFLNYTHIYSSKFTLKCRLFVDNNKLKNSISFCWCASSLPGVHNRLLSTAKWMSTALPCSRYCTNQWIFLHWSANLEYYLYRACDPRRTHYNWTIEHSELDNVFTQIWIGNHHFANFELPQSPSVAQVTFLGKVVWGLRMAHLFLCTSSVSADSVQWHFVNGGTRLFEIHEPLPGVFLSQPSHI